MSPRVSRRAVVTAAAGAAGLACAGGLTRFFWMSSESAPSRHVIIITIDTLRADHLGCYGYRRKVNGRSVSLTPNIDRFAAKGAVFENCIAQSNTTCTSMYSLFYSSNPRYPTGEDDRVGFGFMSWTTMNLYTSESLVEVLRVSATERGQMRTFAVHTNPLLETGRFEKLFEYMATPTPFPLARRTADAEQVTGDALRQVRSFKSMCDEARGRRFNLFQHLHYMDVHGPDAVPARFYEALGTKPLPRKYFRIIADPGTADGLDRAQLEEMMPLLLLRKKPTPYTPDEMEIIRRLDANYDARLMYMDEQFGRLIRGLQESGIGDDALVIITADHGESLGEHGEFLHSGSMYQTEIRVPLILAGKGIPAGGRIGAVVRNLDVLQTAYEFYLDARAINPWRDGRSLFPLIEGRDNRNREAYSWSPIVARRILGGNHVGALVEPTRPLKYIVEANSKEVVSESLFDLSRDPDETSDLAEKYPEHRRKMAERFLEIRNASTGARPAEEREDISPEVRERLKALGYVM
ncbi:MAG: sulfatase [Planctomycetota bacterium]|jgi:arylsulfatase A-like enzyme